MLSVAIRRHDLEIELRARGCMMPSRTESRRLTRARATATYCYPAFCITCCHSNCFFRYFCLDEAEDETV